MQHLHLRHQDWPAVIVDVGRTSTVFETFETGLTAILYLFKYLERTASPRPSSIPPSGNRLSPAPSSTPPFAAASSTGLSSPLPIHPTSISSSIQNIDGFSPHVAALSTLIAPMSAPAHQPPSIPHSTSLGTFNGAAAHPLNTFPAWLDHVRGEVQSRFPHDRFELTMKSGLPKVRCLECEPRKVYDVGPDETLSNFEVCTLRRM